MTPRDRQELERVLRENNPQMLRDPQSAPRVWGDNANPGSLAMASHPALPFSKISFGKPVKEFFQFSYFVPTLEA